MPQTPRRSFLNARPRMTYGRSRSSINDKGGDVELLKATTNTSVKRSLQESFSVSSTLEEQQKSLRASHELQEAGQGHRFQDELEYLLEGIQERERLQVRRQSCIDLTRSTMKKDFAVYLTIYGHWPAIAGVLIRSQDQIIMSCLALMMAILAKQQEACKVLYETEGLQGFILSVFNQEQDPFDMPKNQRDATITNTLKEVAQEAGIVRRGQRVLLSSILLQMLASLSDNMAAYIGSKSPSTNLLVDDVLTKSLEFLIMDMAWLRQTSEYPHMSLSDLIDLDRVLNILRILEVASRGSIAVSELLMTRPKFFQIVTQLLVLSRRHASQGADQNDAVTLMVQVLRLLVNVTHKNEAFCEMLAQHDAVSALVVNIIQLHLLRQRKSHSPTRRQDTCEDVIQDWYDVLLLSVGLVINMLEKNSKRKHEFLNTAINLECPGIGPCLQGDCSCLKSNQVLERVIEMYRAETHLQVEGNVLAAYLAILIVRVVEDEKAGQDRLVKAVGMEGLQDMGLLLDNFGSLYRSLLESTSEEERVSENDEGSTVEGKKATSKDEMIRDTHQSILITIQILKRIQNSRMNGE